MTRNNQAASALGKLAKGKKKNLSPQEIARRRKQMAEARKKRWSIWEGVVEVFDVNGHPDAKRGYGWEYEENGEKRSATVLGGGQIDSPVAAVRAFIVDQSQKGP